MFNLTFISLEAAKKLNNRTEEQLVSDLQAFYKNQNYRSDYNKKKGEIVKLLANDPIVVNRVKELKAKAK